MRSLVHLNALRAFEASARHGSFSAAADELNVTPAAVGQLVRGLEEWAGASLFRRSQSGKHRLSTTAAADAALPDIRAGLERLRVGLGRLEDASTGGVLTVTVSPAFAAKWLLPRIDRFQAICPSLDIRLDTSLKLADYVAHGIDIGVRYGAGQWPGLHAEKLMDEEIFPVASPRLLEDRQIEDPGDLAKQTLIHDLSVASATGFTTWADWLSTAGAPGNETALGLKINNSAAVLQAAIDSQGIALARSILARDDIAAGRLVRLMPDIRVASQLAYYVVYREGSLSLQRVAAFRDWLFEEVQTDAGVPRRAATQ